ncbi:small ubiquitin-related modifier 2-like [Humulus lupulus]|uniref:small ubiquitin-related modifier 2-like n=1 Tax=Humulus lupulus TaxID=3486 RepID=UPI002B41303B|nr:small ubiquitin-related modifier 2-like [Humulus lupulus]
MNSISHKRKSMDKEGEHVHDDDDKVNIKVVSQGTVTSETFFTIRKKCRLYKLLHRFCEHQNVDYRNMEFLYNGKRISPKHTPHSLKMEDGDHIDAMMHADGGGAF